MMSCISYRLRIAFGLGVLSAAIGQPAGSLAATEQSQSEICRKLRAELAPGKPWPGGPNVAVQLLELARTLSKEAPAPACQDVIKRLTGFYQKVVVSPQPERRAHIVAAIEAVVRTRSIETRREAYLFLADATRPYLAPCIREPGCVDGIRNLDYVHDWFAFRRMARLEGADISEHDETAETLLRERKKIPVEPEATPCQSPWYDQYRNNPSPAVEPGIEVRTTSQLDAHYWDEYRVCPVKPDSKWVSVARARVECADRRILPRTAPANDDRIYEAWLEISDRDCEGGTLEHVATWLYIVDGASGELLFMGLIRVADLELYKIELSYRTIAPGSLAICLPGKKWETGADPWVLRSYPEFVIPGVYELRDGYFRHTQGPDAAACKKVKSRD